MSPFYAAKYQHRFPITFLLLERLSLTNLESENVESVLAEYLGRTPSDQDTLYLIERLKELTPSEEEPVLRKIPNKDFATKYLDFLAELSVHDRLLYLTDFDYQKAQYLYCNVDRDIVCQLLDIHARAKMQEAIIAFEAHLFGTGGKYAGTQDSNTQVIDLSEGFDLGEINAFLM